jgi:hypothetical protein
VNVEKLNDEHSNVNSFAANVALPDFGLMKRTSLQMMWNVGIFLSPGSSILGLIDTVWPLVLQHWTKLNPLWRRPECSGAESANTCR